MSTGLLRSRAALALLASTALLMPLGSAPAQHADHAHTGQEQLGTVHFPISCSPAAQAQFDRAVAMLHSFFFPETVKAFAAVAESEPSCAMAYWGVAISQRPNPLVGPFPPEVLKRGWEAVEKARAAGPKTERERDWIEALAAFFQDHDTVDQRTRTLNYEAAMARLAARYPDDDEAAVFHALALNEAADLADKTYARQLEAAAILERVEARQPDHPGIVHYIIHSYDYAPLAEKGLAAARRYADLAPSAPHALHMPSHIFSTLGLWQEAIRADRASDESIRAYAARLDPGAAAKQAANPGRYHSLDFLTNAYLQLAQDGQAKRILDERNSVAEFPASFRYTGHTAFAAIPVRYALERGAWTEAAALPVPTTPYPQAEAIAWFGRALGAARSGDVNGAKADAERIRALGEKLRQAKDAYWAGQVEIQAKAAAAWIALAEGRADQALADMRAAADLEDRSEKHVAMENRLVPMRELLAEMLLQADRSGPALQEFEASLRTTPNRYRSFAGAAAAAERAGDAAKAKEYRRKLVELGSAADTERPELAAARQSLARN